MQILNNIGKITHEIAIALAHKEYDKYNTLQLKNYVSDFDILVNNFDDLPDII